MGVDLCIKSNVDPSAEIVREMHEDGKYKNFVPKKFNKDVYIYYFCDSYNGYNLAWIAGKSYFYDFKKDPEAFLIALSGVTDERIEWYYRRIFGKDEELPLDLLKEADEERIRIF